MRDSRGWVSLRTGHWLLAFVALATLASHGCALRPDSLNLQGRTAEPSFWVVEGASGGRLYLLGSVHTGEAGGWKYPSSIEAAFAESQVLVVEVDVRENDLDALAEIYRSHALLPHALRLSSVVSPRTLELMDAKLPALGTSRLAFERYQPWFAAVALVELASAQMGLDPGAGVDRAFLARAGDEREVVALETADEQILTLDSLPAEVQELMLRDTLVGLDDLKGQIQRLLDAWRRGDDERLATLVFEGLDDQPGYAPFYQAIFFDRNARMADHFDELIGSRRIVFGVVGAGHLLGDQGIPTLLRERGLRVEKASDR